MVAVNPKDLRYTRASTRDFCLRLVGLKAWDLDAAADLESTCAPYWYGVEQDGLMQPWFGNVWVNPPFSNIEAWVQKAWLEIEQGRPPLIAMLLPCNRTDQPWWQALIEPVRDGKVIGQTVLKTHFLPGRIKFGQPGDREGVHAGSPPFGCVLVVWRKYAPNKENR